MGVFRGRGLLTCRFSFCFFCFLNHQERVPSRTMTHPNGCGLKLTSPKSGCRCPSKAGSFEVPEKGWQTSVDSKRFGSHPFPSLKGFHSRRNGGFRFVFNPKGIAWQDAQIIQGVPGASMRLHKPFSKWRKLPDIHWATPHFQGGTRRPPCSPYLFFRGWFQWWPTLPG